MKRKKAPRMSDLVADEKLRAQFTEALYSDKPLLGDKEGIFTQLLQAFVNASLEGELDHHIGASNSEKAASEEATKNNRRNGYTTKSVKSAAGNIKVNTPRDRDATFEPVLIEKRKKQLKGGLDEAILALFAQGNSNEAIHRLIGKMYGVNYPRTAISAITDQVWPKINEWQQRLLQPCYAILYLDGIFFKVKEDGQFQDMTVYSVYGVDVHGNRDCLGIYLQRRECASEWGMVLEDLKRRGVQDVLFACIDGLPGFKDRINQVFELTIVQRCIVHKIRNSVRYASDKELKKICKDLRTVYSAANRQQAEIALNEFEIKWGTQGERIAKLWRKDWDDLMQFMDYSENLRRMIYTTNPVENLHRIIRKITKSKGAWTSKNALIKQIYLALTHNEKSWKRSAYSWKSIQEELELKFGDRFAQWITK